MRSPVAVVTLAALVFASVPLQAGPVMESALRKAATMRLGRAAVVQPSGCDQAVLDRGRAAGEDRGVGGYIAGGIFLPVIMPLIADAGSNPSAPLIQVQGLESDEATCFSAAYGERLKDRKVGAAWTGTWIGIGLVVLSAAAASS